MCTVSIHRRGVGLSVTMNRDEAIDRGPESPPKLFNDGYSPWAAPIDQPSGGTWMGVNGHGVVGCLLNGYFPGDMTEPAPPGAPSRGCILPACLPEGPLDAVEDWVSEKLDAGAYASFVLMLATTERVVEYRWLRAEAVRRSECDDDWTLVTSSGWAPDEVRAWRKKTFDEWLASGCPEVGHVPAFHLLHDSEAPAHSVLVQRPWSRTRSITQAQVDLIEGSVLLRYWPVQDDQSLGALSHIDVPATLPAASRC